MRAVRAALDALHEPHPALVLRCANRIPHGRGLGSSAAAVVAGLLAGRALVPDGTDRLSDDAVLLLANAFEGHPDNAAACLLGGLTLAWTDAGPLPAVHAVRLEPRAELGATVLVPEAELATATARGLLPETVPHADAAHTAGRAALLVAALTAVPGLLLPATEDRLHQGYRASAMPRHRRAGAGAAGRGPGRRGVRGRAERAACCTRGRRRRSSRRPGGARWRWPSRATEPRSSPVDPHRRVAEDREPPRVGWCYARHRTRSHCVAGASPRLPARLVRLNLSTTVAPHRRRLDLPGLAPVKPGRIREAPA